MGTPFHLTSAVKVHQRLNDRQKPDQSEKVNYSKVIAHWNKNYPQRGQKTYCGNKKRVSPRGSGSTFSHIWGNPGPEETERRICRSEFLQLSAFFCHRQGQPHSYQGRAYEGE